MTKADDVATARVGLKLYAKKWLGVQNKSFLRPKI